MKQTPRLKGSALNPPAPVALRYTKQLRALVAKMVAEAERTVRHLYRVEDSIALDASIGSQARIEMNALALRLDTLFSDKAKPMAEVMVGKVSKSSEVSLKNSVKGVAAGFTLPASLFHDEYGDIAKATIAENVALIKSIPEQFMKRLEGKVYRSIAQGEGLEGVAKALRQYGKMSDRRVKLIADDQVRKAYNNINAERMKRVGITKGEWIHSRGGREPRKTHVAFNGRVFELDKGLYDSSVGEYVLPAQLPNCRCSFRPVIEFDEDDDV